MERHIRAGELFLSGYNCAQSVAMAFADLMGMDEKTAARASSAFGGGIGRMREVCGAVSGMMMVLSVLYGYDQPEDNAGKRELYRHVQALAGQFREEVGSIICREILGNPPSTPDPTPRTQEFYAQRPCARMVMTAARLLEEFIQTHPMS